MIYFSTHHKEHQENKVKKGKKRWHRKQLISSLTQDLSVSLVMVESDTGRQAVRASGTAGGGGGEGRRDSLLSSDLSRLEPVHKVFDCLVLEVGAHVAGEGPICVALFCHSKNTQ